MCSNLMFALFYQQRTNLHLINQQILLLANSEDITELLLMEVIRTQT